jgi:hypothetical protein
VLARLGNRAEDIETSVKDSLYYQTTSSEWHGLQARAAFDRGSAAALKEIATLEYEWLSKDEE